MHVWAGYKNVCSVSRQYNKHLIRCVLGCLANSHIEAGTKPQNINQKHEKSLFLTVFHLPHSQCTKHMIVYLRHVVLNKFFVKKNNTFLNIESFKNSKQGA